MLWGEQKQQPATGIQKLLPSSEEIKPWSQQGDAQLFRGDDLFLFINGGADIYHEYGFVQVLSAEYQNPAGHAVNLEIFEMKDSDSGFGIYSYKIGDGGTPVDLGNGGLLEDYFLNFWKGRYLVTLTSLQTGSDSSKDLIFLAGLVQKKIAESGSPPGITRHFPGANIKSITYFKGNLGLMKIYQFHHENIFHFREGIHIRHPASSTPYSGTFVMAYKTPEEAEKNYHIALKKIAAGSQFSMVPGIKKGNIFSDKKGRRFLMEPEGPYIYIKEIRDPHRAPDR